MIWLLIPVVLIGPMLLALFFAWMGDRDLTRRRKRFEQSVRYLGKRGRS